MIRRFIYTLLFVILFAETGFSFCFEEAASMYGVSPEVLKAISWVESQYQKDAVNINKNGTQDRCHMQVNECWEKLLGEGWQYLLSDPCYCTKAGAWILRQCMDRYGNSWDAVACYNAGHALNELKGNRRMKAYEYVKKVQDYIY